MTTSTHTILTLPDARVRVDGAAASEDTGDGVRYHRVATRFHPQMAADLALIQSMPAGVRLVFDTDATEVSISATPIRLAFPGEPPRPAVFAARCAGREVASAAADFGHVIQLQDEPPGFSFEAGATGTVVLDGLPAGVKTVEVWLPHASGVTVHSVGIPEDATMAAAPADGRPRWLHHGSSISHCMEADSPLGTWPAVAAEATGHHLIGMGLAGQCQLDQFSARTIRDTTVDVISLKLGINVVNGDTLKLRTFGPAVHGFLDTIREGQPDTPILIISPIFCPAVEDLPGPTFTPPGGRCSTLGTRESQELGSLSLGQVRSILSGIVETRLANGDRNLSYLDGRELFGEADVDDLPDALHPNAAGYRRMGERFAAHGFLRR